MKTKINELHLEDMLTDTSNEEDLMEVPLTDRVFVVFFIIAIVAASVVVAQLAHIGGFKHLFYQARAFTNMSEVRHEVVPRGLILDRFGEVIVENEPAFRAFLVPHKLPTRPEERFRVLKEVSGITGEPFRELQQKLEKTDWNKTDRMLVGAGLSPDAMVTFLARNIPGIAVEPAFRRVYPAPLAFSHLVGHVGLVGEDDIKERGFAFHEEVGKTGIEQAYDENLRGRNGKREIIRNARGEIQEERMREEGKSGDRLRLFIDREFQDYFYRRLLQTITTLGAKGGVGIAMRPENGEVVSLFSIPSFDAGDIAPFLQKPDDPLFNRAIAGLYAPGSTIKPFVAVAGLAEGTISPEDEIFSKGFIEIPNPYHPEAPSRFVDWKAHGWVNLASALARSSNVYFYALGGGLPKTARNLVRGNQAIAGLGIERLEKWWRMFRLDALTQIDLPGESVGSLPDAAGRGPRKDSWRLGDLYNISIGQGDLLVTPIALLNAVNAIANGGKFYTPRIVADAESQDGRLTFQSASTVAADLSNELRDTLPLVERGMRDAVEKPYGTASLLHDLPFRVAAKTGSTQVENKKKLNALFLGYTAFDAQEVAGLHDLSILVLVEHSREGSLNAVPVAKDVLLWYYTNRVRKSSISNSSR